MNNDVTSPGRRPRLAVTYYPIDSLKPNLKNPQKHTRQQIAKIAKSIRAFDFNCPVLIDPDLQILAGHGRWEASKSLGMTEIATIRLDHLGPVQARAFMIADNQLTKAAAWDDAVLDDHLRALSELKLDFDLDATGFDLEEIELRIHAPDDSKSEDGTMVEQLPAVPSRPVTQPGDLWRLNAHMLLCGNALDAPSYEQLMAGERAEVVFTDPLYSASIQDASGRGGIEQSGFVRASAELPHEDYVALLKTAMGLIAQHSGDGSIHFLCTHWRRMFEFLEVARSVYAEHVNTCVWVKSNTGMASLYRDQHEFVGVFRYGDKVGRDKMQPGRLGRARTNVWHYPGAATLMSDDADKEGLALHPAVRPAAMIADALTDCSDRGALMLDPFGGSGSALIAAERTGRRARLMELNPKYVDVIVQRWERFTGGAAVHAASGQSYAQRRHHD